MSYLDEQRNLLKKELSEIKKPLFILSQKMQKAKTNVEYSTLENEMEKIYLENDGELLKKENSLKERIHQCNIERMLGHRRDLVNTYLVINSTLSDAYNILFSLPENSKKIKEIENLIFELENGLSDIESNLNREGLSKEEAFTYNKKYEK